MMLKSVAVKIGHLPFEGAALVLVDVVQEGAWVPHTASQYAEQVRQALGSPPYAQRWPAGLYTLFLTDAPTLVSFVEHGYARPAASDE